MMEQTENQEIEITNDNEPETVEVVVEETAEGDNTEQVQEETNQEKNEFDPKKDRVEFTTPEQQAKFDDVYKQMKMSDKRNQMLTDFLSEQQKQLDEQKKIISDLTGRFTATDQAEAEKTLMSKIQTARAEGDDAAYDTALRELIAFEANKISDEKVNAAIQKETKIENDQAQYVATLMSETDHDGNYVRPWLHETHPGFSDAIQQLSVIAYKYWKDPNVLQKSLKELDEVMSKKTTNEPPKKETPPMTRAPNPMQGSNLTNKPPKGTIRMTKQEAEILRKLEQGSGRKIDLKKYAARRDSMNGGR